MKNFAQALSQIINTPRLCSEIPASMAKELMRKEIILQEKDSNKIFKAKVVDYAYPNNGGLVVRIARADVPGLVRKYKMSPAEFNSEKFVECDMRNPLQGEGFLFLGENKDK